jgi:hypothetical protein
MFSAAARAMMDCALGDRLVDFWLFNCLEMFGPRGRRDVAKSGKGQVMSRFQRRTISRIYDTDRDRDSWTLKPAIVMAAVTFCVSICVGVIVGTSDAIVGVLMVAGR